MATISGRPLSLVKFGLKTIPPTSSFNTLEWTLSVYTIYLLFFRHFGTFTWSAFIEALPLKFIYFVILLMKFSQTLVLGDVDFDKPESKQTS